MPGLPADAIRVRAYAKLNLTLHVLGRRPDGFHELRTVFQTISLADRLTIRATRSRRTEVQVETWAGREPVDIPDNLAARAAEAVLGRARRSHLVQIRIEKNIPMGGGLGGGSSDAAAVVLALPGLVGWSANREQLEELALPLGSDVPFFLTGGTAVGLSRGEELYAAPSAQAHHVLVIAPGIHVSTPEMYRALERPPRDLLTAAECDNTIKRFRSFVGSLAASRRAGLPDPAWQSGSANDFESAVFARHPRVEKLCRRLRSAGAVFVRMSGSGSTVFGIFESAERLEAAREAVGRSHPEVVMKPVRFVTRESYRAAWRRMLGGSSDASSWPVF